MQTNGPTCGNCGASTVEHCNEIGCGFLEAGNGEPMSVTERDTEKLRHMLGAVPGRWPKNKWGWRNYYAAGSAGDESMQRLVAAGLATQGRTMEGGMTYFHATKDGCKAVGLDAKGIKRAFED